MPTVKNKNNIKKTSVNVKSSQKVISRNIICAHGIACYRCDICERDLVISGLREEISNYKKQLYLIQNTVDRMNVELQESHRLFPQDM